MLWANDISCIFQLHIHLGAGIKRQNRQLSQLLQLFGVFCFEIQQRFLKPFGIHNIDFRRGQNAVVLDDAVDDFGSMKENSAGV